MNVEIELTLLLLNLLEISDKNKSQGGVISTILMVGGFSDCPLLHERVTSEFPKLNVICPSDAVATVLKGAVMYGHNPITPPWLLFLSDISFT
jgi:actin-related protein